MSGQINKPEEPGDVAVEENQDERREQGDASACAFDLASSEAHRDQPTRVLRENAIPILASARYGSGQAPIRQQLGVVVGKWPVDNDTDSGQEGECAPERGTPQEGWEKQVCPG